MCLPYVVAPDTARFPAKAQPPYLQRGERGHAAHRPTGTGPCTQPPGSASNRYPPARGRPSRARAARAAIQGHWAAQVGRPKWSGHSESKRRPIHDGSVAERARQFQVSRSPCQRLSAVCAELSIFLTGIDPRNLHRGAIAMTQAESGRLAYSQNGCSGGIIVNQSAQHEPLQTGRPAAYLL